MVLSTQSSPRKASLRNAQQNAPLPTKAAAVSTAPRQPSAPRHRPLAEAEEPARARGTAPNMAAAEQKGCGSGRGAPHRRQALPCRMEMAAPGAPSRLPFPQRAPPVSRLRRRQEPGRLFVLCEGGEPAPLLRRRHKTAPSTRGTRPGPPGKGRRGEAVGIPPASPPPPSLYSPPKPEQET